MLGINSSKTSLLQLKSITEELERKKIKNRKRLIVKIMQREINKDFLVKKKNFKKITSIKNIS